MTHPPFGSPSGGGDRAFSSPPVEGEPACNAMRGTAGSPQAGVGDCTASQNEGQ